MTRGKLKSERGAVMVLTALALFALAGMMTFAIDVAHWFDYSRNLQARADAAALAAGDAYGNICFTNSSIYGDTQTGAQSAIGKWAQLYTGAGVNEPAGNLPYTDGAVSASPTNPSATGGPGTGWNVGVNGYINNTQSGSPVNSPISVAGGSLSDFLLRLNADDYATSNGTNFAMGDFCNSDPRKDLTDHNPGPPGAMVDVKLTQRQLPNFIPIFGSLGPNISAHARVEIQGLGEINHIRPLEVPDPSSTGCVRVIFRQTNGSDPSTPLSQTIVLPPDGLTAGGAGIFDNRTANAFLGNQIQIPTGANLYMQTQLYQPGSTGDCNSVSVLSPVTTYNAGTGLLYLDSYGASVPSDGNPPALVGNGPANAGGVSLLNNTCSPDQYFSTGASCSVRVCAIVGFTKNSTNPGLTVNGAAMAPSADPLCATTISGASAWTKTLSINAAPNGLNQFDVGWRENVTTKLPSGCTGNSPYSCSGDFGVTQQSFAGCNEAANQACNNYPDPNDSGPIVQAKITDSGTGLSWVGSFQGGVQRYLVVRVDLAGLQDAAASDRCPTKCTVLRFGTGQADGSVNCGQGQGSASNTRLSFLNGCPSVGDPACIQNSVLFCGSWTQTPDGSCNNLTSRPPGSAPVDCVGNDNSGATIPECAGALIQVGGILGGPGSNGDACNVSSPTGQCSEDHWITDGFIQPNDPRIIDSFTVYPGDITGTGNTYLPIRNFAAFYVTGWDVHGNGKQVSCPATGPGANEAGPAFPGPGNPPPTIWGHWMSYVIPGGGGTGQPCNFQQGFGLCTPVLTR